ncbi:MAG: tRNA uridine-5-carboxymethylaminomethyl(34) synthesis GTPase MnmE [Nitrospinae bacterium]|nr:tRNA uridine-5-carboxymethylaminomethyl(34) synthesis GTPase MnmE [Nitrospinota bacterium]
MNTSQDTISAISTPHGEGGIGIVRLSGPSSVDIVKEVFVDARGERLKEVISHRITYGFIVDPDDGKRIDEVLLTVMLAPRSYTMEDIVEISCHGGMTPLTMILNLMVERGARLAEPGEFTKRAFLNGRIDLAQAEAVIDVIRSRSDVSLRMAIRHMEGDLSKEISSLREDLIGISAQIEASIDLPEEDIEIESMELLLKRSEGILKRIETLLNTFDHGRILREGAKTIIIGRTNVGKSSLLNALLNKERAIVTPIPGTTRDSIEEMISIDGIHVNIIDTAGIRKRGGYMERVGIKRTMDLLKDADIVLMMLDGSESVTDDDRYIMGEVKDKNLIIIINKIDLPQVIEIEGIKRGFPDNRMYMISATKKMGLDLLKDGIKELLIDKEITPESPLITRIRHREALIRAKEGMENAIEGIKGLMSEEFIALDINGAMESLGEITGQTFSEDVLNKIFSDFCIGK